MSEPSCAAREHAREIESETVDSELLDPVLEALHDEAGNQRMVAVDGVSASGVVAIAAPVAGVEVIEDVVREPLEADHRPRRAAFGGVVERDVEQHADIRRMQRVGERAELALGLGGIRAIAWMRAMEAVGAVAPVVREASCRSGRGYVLRVESHHRHQLHVRDAQALRYGIFSMSPAKVPGERTPLEEMRVKPPTCSS